MPKVSELKTAAEELAHTELAHPGIRREHDGAGARGRDARDRLPDRPRPVADRACPPAGSMPLILRISPTVDAATLTPRPASSPWILR